MAPFMCQVFLTIFVLNKISFASGRVFKSGTFKYLHRHPKLKSCAVEVLKENIYVGARVHDLTGVCEGLTHSWTINQTTESGYAYAKKQWVEERYIPPTEMTDLLNSEWYRYIPVVLGAGSEVEVTMTVSADVQRFSVELKAEDMDFSVYKLSYDTLEIVEKGFILTEEKIIDNRLVKQESLKYGRVFGKETKIKITFQPLTESLMVHVDDQTLRLKNTTLELTTVKQIYINSRKADADTNSDEVALKLHSFKFTGI